MRIELGKRTTPQGTKYHAKLIEIEFNWFFWKSFDFHYGTSKGWTSGYLWILYFSYIDYEWDDKQRAKEMQQ